MGKNIQITVVIDRQVALVIGAAIGAILIGMIGVSAHSGPQPILQLAGVHEPDTHRDEASGARTESRESPGSSKSSAVAERAGIAVQEAGPIVEKASNTTEKPETQARPWPTAAPSHDYEGGDRGE